MLRRPIRISKAGRYQLRVRRVRKSNGEAITEAGTVELRVYRGAAMTGTPLYDSSASGNADHVTYDTNTGIITWEWPGQVVSQMTWQTGFYVLRIRYDNTDWHAILGGQIAIS